MHDASRPTPGRKRKAAVDAGCGAAVGSRRTRSAIRRAARLVRPPSPQAAVARGPGETPDPYRVWLSEIMLQQTTVKTVAPYYARFLERFPTVERLGAAPLDDVLQAPGPGSATTRAAATCMPARRPWWSVTAAGFPRPRRRLSELPGIGPYTAAAIAAIAFDEPATPGRRQYRARDRAAVRGRGRAAATPSRRSAPCRDAHAGAPRRRFRAGDDGSRRHDLHAEEAGLRALSVERALRGARARRCRDISAQGRQARPASCGAARPSWCCAPTGICWCARGRPRACSAA